MRLSKIANEVVNNPEVFKVVYVGSEYRARYARQVGNKIQQSTLYFIEALADVSGAASEFSTKERGMLNGKRSGVPGVAGTDPGDAGKHLRGGPRQDPRFHVMEARTGPKTVVSRCDKQRSVGKWIVGFG